MLTEPYFKNTILVSHIFFFFQPTHHLQQQPEKKIFYINELYTTVFKNINSKRKKTVL
ncbi:unnamed protein product [Brassica oleracea var. botrytis]